MVMAVRVSVCLSLAALPHCCTDSDVTWGNGRGCPLVVHYWADMQSVHGFRCYDNTAPNAKCQRLLVLALCLVIIIITDIPKAQERLRLITVWHKTRAVGVNFSGLELHTRAFE